MSAVSRNPPYAIQASVPAARAFSIYAEKSTVAEL
jgi:hypothetical protein